LLNPPALGVIFRLKQQFPETLDVFAPDEAFHGRPLADRPPAVTVPRKGRRPP
jgi:hypothetical protein